MATASVAGFVQGDDAAILAAVRSRDAAVTPLLRCDACGVRVGASPDTQLCPDLCDSQD